MKGILTSLALMALLTVPAFAQETLQGTIIWDEESARREALKHIERQINPQFFKTKSQFFFDNMKTLEQNPDLKFGNKQVTFFTGGEYSVVYEGEKIVHYYTKEGKLFKVSVCSHPYGDDWIYPRRCIEYGYPSGKFMTVSMDVSPEESYVFALDGTLIQHWKDEQGFNPQDNTTWERWNYDEPETETN
jgi:hypothetical protein